MVFLLGLVQHQVADISWHSLGIDQGFLQTMGQVVKRKKEARVILGISDVIKNALYRQRRPINKSFSRGKNMTLQVNR